MKKLLIGAGCFGKDILEHASQEYNCAFADDDTVKDGTVIQKDWR